MTFLLTLTHISRRNPYLDNLLLRTEWLAVDQQLLSYQQTAEWGMCAVRGAFGRLRVPLDVNAEQ